MTYGPSKQRDMVRSVLPSRQRNAARNDLRNIKQRNRAQVHRGLHYINRGATSADVIENYDESALDINFYPDAEIKYVVQDRQLGDNLSAFLSWAPHQVKDVRLLDRMSKMLAIMPDNLAVRHAVSHLENEDDFLIPYDHRRIYGRRSYQFTAEEKKWVKAAEYAAGVEELRRICNTNRLHHKFNDTHPHRWIYKAISYEDFLARRPIWVGGGTNSWRDGYYRGDPNVVCRSVEGQRGKYWERNKVNRPLLGVHDIDTFLSEVDSESLALALKKIGV